MHNPVYNHKTAFGSNEEHIQGITCDVTNCHYHSGGNLCTAKQIKVGPQYASSSADTICVTFKPQ